MSGGSLAPKRHCVSLNGNPVAKEELDEWEGVQSRFRRLSVYILRFFEPQNGIARQSGIQWTVQNIHLLFDCCNYQNYEGAYKIFHQTLLDDPRWGSWVMTNGHTVNILIKEPALLVCIPPTLLEFLSCGDVMALKYVCKDTAHLVERNPTFCPTTTIPPSVSIITNKEREYGISEMMKFLGTTEDDHVTAVILWWWTHEKKKFN